MTSSAQKRKAGFNLKIIGQLAYWTHSSDIKSIAYGVPQCSVRGPLLFLLYINDIQQAANNTHLRSFADNMAIFLHNKNITDLTNQGTETMKLITEWFMTKKLTLSIGKSKFLLFHGRRKNSHEYIKAISIGKDEIPRVTQFKYIGLTLDENLTWEPHINNICSALVRYYSIFYNIRNSITFDIARAIYYACIYPHTSYTIEIYGTANDTLMSKLQVQQNKLLKLITKRDYRCSTNKLHHENRILQVKHIHELYTLAFVFRCLKDTPIEPFKDFFMRRGEEHEYDLRNNENLSNSQIFLNTGKITTHTDGAVLWNKYPANITDLNDIGSFKKVSLNIILKYSKNKLSAYTAYTAMFVVRDRVPNLITHLLLTPPIETAEHSANRLAKWAPQWHAKFTCRVVSCRAVPCRAVPYRAVPCRVSGEHLDKLCFSASHLIRYWKNVKLYVHAMLMYLIVSFEK